MNGEAILEYLRQHGKRFSSASKPSSPPVQEPPPTTDVRAASSELDRLEELVAQANQGDARAAEAVGRFFADGSSAWQHLGDLADIARKALASSLSGQQIGLALALERQMREQLASLVDEDVSPLERMMIDRVVIAWGFAHAVDLIAATAGEAMLTPSVTKAQETAEKRCKAALSSLQLAREISRGAAGRPLRLVTPLDEQKRTASSSRAAV